MRDEVIKHNRETLNHLLDRNKDLLAEVNNPDTNDQVKMAMMREILKNSETIIKHSEHFAVQGHPDDMMKFQDAAHSLIKYAYSWLNNH